MKVFFDFFARILAGEDVIQDNFTEFILNDGIDDFPEFSTSYTPTAITTSPSTNIKKPRKKKKKKKKGRHRTKMSRIWNYSMLRPQFYTVKRPLIYRNTHNYNLRPDRYASACFAVSA